MSEEYAPYFMIAFAIAFLFMWFAVTSLLRAMAKMSKVIQIDIGRPLRKSKWGSGNVNGVSMRNCLRVVSYSDGFVLETQRIFGNGKLWLPKDKIVLGKVSGKGLFKPKSIELLSEDNRITLFGVLVDEII